MSIFTDIQSKTRAKGKTANWYRWQFTQKISQYAQSRPEIGELFYFKYGAKFADRLDYWDKYPMAYCISIDSTGWLGMNFHYMNPLSRYGSAQQILATDNREELFFPRATIHRYRYTEQQGPLYKLPKDEWDSVKLPLEEFVDSSPIGVRSIPGKTVWGN